MNVKNIIANVAARARALRASRDGNVAIIFALSVIPVVGLVGASIDYSRANSVKADLQAALDATALMTSKTAASLTSSQLTTTATNYFNALYSHTDTSTPALTISYSTSSGSSLTISGTTSMAPKFINIVPGLGNNITINASSTVNWGTTRLRVALVLDVSGSMNDDGKISALQSATKSLLTQLKNAVTTNGDVYVSIIPFSKNVNIGTSNYSASYLDWTDWEAEPSIIASSKPSGWDQVNGGDACPFSSSSYGFGCAPTPTSTSTTSTVPNSGTYAGYICPSTDTGAKNSTKVGMIYNGCYNSVQATRTIASGSGASCGTNTNCSCSGSGKSKVCTQTYYNHTWIVNSHSTWDGCVTDRGASTAPSGDYDRLTTAPGSTTASQFPAEQNSYCSNSVVTGLTYDWTGLNTAVNNLSPLGATNQPIGLGWGWQTLVGGGPFTAPAKDPSYIYNDVIILMSDGLNTLDRWYGDGSSTSTSVDQRMYQSSTVGTCANIKAANVTIYTLQVNTEGDPTSTLLQNCASTSDKFYLVTSASGIATVFNTIGTNLSSLRLK